MSVPDPDLVETLFDRYVEQLVVHSVRLTAEELCGEENAGVCTELQRRIAAYEDLDSALTGLRQLIPGRQLGPYEIAGELGHGGMGAVYAAIDRRTGERLALKLISDRWGQDSRRRRRFEREAMILDRLAHPNVVRFRSFEVIEPFVVLAMDLVEGRDLAAAIVPGGMPVATLYLLADAILQALECAHANGVLHRDLKPGNVMWDGGDAVKVLDFGLGTLMGHERVVTLTRTGEVLGTLPYLSPEALLGRPTDERGDLFSFGATLYECATGNKPFQGVTASEIMRSVCDDEPAPLAACRSDLPAAFCSAISACLAKQSPMRPASASAVRSEIDREL